MWVMGSSQHDLWNSDDGSSWTLVSNSPPYGRPIVFDNKIWVIGTNKVWNSMDGVNWALVTDKPAYGQIDGAAVLDFQNRIWLLGRPYNNDVWYSQGPVQAAAWRWMNYE